MMKLPFRGLSRAPDQGASDALDRVSDRLDQLIAIGQRTNQLLEQLELSTTAQEPKAGDSAPSQPSSVSKRAATAALTQGPNPKETEPTGGRRRRKTRKSQPARVAVPVKLHEAIIRVLLDAGEPLTANDIAARIRERDDGLLTAGNGATYTYDEAGNPLTAATADGITVNYAYDRAGRLLEVAHTGASDTLSRFTYALDAAGNRTAMTTREGTVTYRYDPLDRLAEACWSDTTCPGGAPTPPEACISCIGGLLPRPAPSTQPQAGDMFVAYAYDPVGNRLSETRDAGSTPSTYDAADRMLTEGTALPGLTTPAPSTDSGAWASGADGYVSDDSYATAAPGKNQTLSQTYGGFDFSAIPTEATIDQVSLSVEWAVDTGSAQATLSAQPLLNASPYGSALTNTAAPTSDTVETLPLTGLSLADLSGGGLAVVIAAAKANGPSFTARLDAVTVSVDYTYGLRTFTYDANGNQLSAGTTAYTYDLADRLASATVGATTETYTYAGDGTRLSATSGGGTTGYVWDRAFGLPQLALERDGSYALLRAYAYGLDLVSQTAGSTTSYYHHDGLGSVVDVTDAAGDSLAWSEYYPFGEARVAGSGAGAPAVQPFAFTGEQLDPLTGLYHLRARQYDPATGRFLSTDPLALPLTDPYVSAYVYVGQHPTRYTDPSGKCFLVCTVAGAVGGAVVGAVSYGWETVQSGEAWDWGEFAGSVGGHTIGGAIVGTTGGAALWIGAAGAAAGTPAALTFAAQASVVGNGALLGWSAETIGDSIVGNPPSRREALQSLGLAVAGPVIDHWTFDYATDALEIFVLPAINARYGASGK